MKQKACSFPPLILASASPRRQELLSLMKIPYEVVIAEINEDSKKNEKPKQLVIRLSKEKAIASKKKILNRKTNSTILAADTIVTCKKKILGKPKDLTEAKKTLAFLSNKTHKVITGVTLILPNNQLKSFSVITKIKFRPINMEEINSYLQFDEWQDAAGSYKIQENGKILIETIKGSLTNVIGLPIEKVVKKLKENGIYP